MFSDCERGPWSVESLAKNIQENATFFNLTFDSLEDVTTLVRIGYLRGRPDSFGLNMTLWDRDKLIFFKIFESIPSGRIGGEERNGSKALLDTLGKFLTSKVKDTCTPKSLGV